MTDLEHRLANLSTPTPTSPDAGPHTDPDTAVRGDLARARRALRERRGRQLGLGAVGVLGSVTVLVVGLGAHGSPAADTAGPTRSPTASASSTRTTTPSPTRTTTPSPTGTRSIAPGTGLRLVEYHGEQTPGFSVRYIPEGFELQGADDVSLAVSRPGSTTDIGNFAHKIVVDVESSAVHGPLDPDAEQIEVHGRPGTLTTLRNGATIIYYHLDDERLVFIQAWQDVALTERQLLRFADGVEVHGQVQFVS